MSLFWRLLFHRILITPDPDHLIFPVYDHGIVRMSDYEADEV